ncbi:ABC transporter permease subunit [Microbacterium sp. ARD31]|jgi:ABC-2 type transport system permease protein|uniref:ABC transporter permease subunit n=1 Tax=unclassified Microbacterium TaxID=2609290 RepID=UPI0020413D0D|nr:MULTISPECIES: ABC transporter permease subunit [unclassified Microbacterium]MDT0181673.1 ABC transporter permease subunit [Microbacterium sp. ARD31]
MSLTTATRSETTKQFTTAMWWVLAIVLAVYIAFTAGVLAFVFAASSSGSLPGGAPTLPEDGLAPVLYSTASSVGYVFPLLIGTLMVTSEFRHKTLTSTFLATPRRGLVLSAKIVVGIVMGVVFGIVGIVAAVGVSAGILAGFGLDTALGDAETWALLGRMLVASVLWVLIGIGVGALVRNQVGAIVGVLVFTQFLEPVGRAAASFVEDLGPVVQYLPGAASDALVGASVFTSMPGASAGELEWWVGGLVLLGYALVLVVLGNVVSWRRDVS